MFEFMFGLIKPENNGRLFEDGVSEDDDADEDRDVEFGDGVFTFKCIGMKA